MSSFTTSLISGTELIRAVQQEDERLLRQFYRQNYPAVERFVLQQSGSADDAADVYQEAFLVVWRNIQQGKYAVQDVLPGAYLFQIAKFKWMDQLRRKKKMDIRTDNEIPDLQMQDEDNSDEYIRLIREQLSSLGEPCREVLLRFYHQKESMKTIALAFSWTEATAKNNKYRCIERLRNRVKEQMHNDQL